VTSPNRRQIVLTALGLLFASTSASVAAVIRGVLPFSSKAAPPPRVTPGPWRYFTPDEGVTIEALVDRLIPADAETPSGKDLGCGVYIDAQLAGPYGSYEGFYMSGPFHAGTKQQGIQSPTTPAEQYRNGLAALDRYCRTNDKNGFAALTDARKDEIIGALESGKIDLDGGVDAKKFFKLLLTDTQNGFLADPIYGGNRNMAGWKMIGFPGARYDYRDWVDRHNERYPYPPIGIADHPNWNG
jgi:gluconate 2-dehydrogenase gamma chain